MHKSDGPFTSLKWRAVLLVDLPFAVLIALERRTAVGQPKLLVVQMIRLPPLTSGMFFEPTPHAGRADQRLSSLARHLQTTLSS
jgi:hypothetical protein